MVIGDIVDIALDRINAADPVIKAHAESEVALWLKDIVRKYDFTFMRKEADTVTLAVGDNSFDLEDDYRKMISIVFIDPDGKRHDIEVVDRSKFDQITDLTTEGLPYMGCAFGSEFRFYFSADKVYTVEYVYYSLYTDAEVANNVEVDFPDKLIEQVASIAALQYDRLETNIEESKLKRMLADFRRGSVDEGVSGDAIPLDHKTHQPHPKNFI